MADIRPFAGIRYVPSRAPLSRALCPPYDVIDAEQAARLRADALNAVHLELPAGEGEAKYENSARQWKAWQDQGVLARDAQPSFYVVEERFEAAGKKRARTGFLAALSVRPDNAKFVVPHERTLPKAKEDRLKLLGAVRANISPIFGIFPDGGGLVRRALAKAKKGKPAAQGTMPSGVAYKLWLLSDPKVCAAIAKSVAPKQVLIADGHHRYEVSRAFYDREPNEGNSTVLAYVCPEEDAGLLVFSTHRVVDGVELAGETQRLCRVTPAKSRDEMLKKLAKARSPYAYGLFEGGAYSVAEPKSANGCKSGLCVEWIGSQLLGGISPEHIRYTPDADKAVLLAQESGKRGSVVFVKPMVVPQIRKAVKAVGLLPPKSTYFFPKIATGLVFKSLL